MAELIRVGVVIDASQARRGAQEAQAALKGVAGSAEEAAFQADLLRDRFARLRQQALLGAISKREYAAELRTLKADMAGLASQTRLTSETQNLLAQSARGVQSELLRTSGMSQRTASGMVRAAFGVDLLASSMGSGRLSAQALSGALLTLSVGNPTFMAIVAGLAAITAMISLLSRTSEDAGASTEDMTTKLSLASRRGRLGVVRGDIARLREAGVTEYRGDLASRAGPMALPTADQRTLGLRIAEERRLLDELARRGGEAGGGRPSRTGAMRFEPEAPIKRFGIPETMKPEDYLTIRLQKGPRGQEKPGSVYVEWETLAQKIEQRWRQMGTNISASLEDALTGMLLGQRGAWAAFFSYIESQLARFAAGAILSYVGEAIAGAYIAGNPSLQMAHATPVGGTINVHSAPSFRIQALDPATTAAVVNRAMPQIVGHLATAIGQSGSLRRQLMGA